jgi:hypothetical protein
MDHVFVELGLIAVGRKCFNFVHYVGVSGWAGVEAPGYRRIVPAATGFFAIGLVDVFVAGQALEPAVYQRKKSMKMSKMLNLILLTEAIVL